MRRPYKHIDLNDKFSDFEHTPEDSSWNTISGGINSRQAAGNLSGKMDELSVSPSSSVWNGIAAQTHPNRKKKAIIWWTYGAAASLISAVLLASLVFNTSTDSVSAYIPREVDSSETLSWDENFTNEENIENTVVNEFDLANNNSEADSHEFQKKNSNLINATIKKNHENNSSLIANQSRNNSEHGDLANDDLDSVVKKVIEDSHELYSSADREENPITNISLTSEDTLVTFKITRHKLEPRFYEDYSLVELKENLAVSTFPFWLMAEDGSLQADRGKSNISLLASTQLNQTNSSTSDGMSFLSANTPNTFTESSDVAIAFGEAASIQFRSQEKFSAPLYFSLNLEKTLQFGRRNRWSTGSGLGYLLMRSSTTYESTEITSVTDIKRNYIAVPLYLKYEFIKKPRWSAYASAGSSAEFGLGGKAETNDFRDGELENSSSSRFNLGVGQFNANTSVGFNIKLGTHLTAFSEASVAHYFYQSNYNFWSSKKLWPGLKTGISLRF